MKKDFDIKNKPFLVFSFVLLLKCAVAWFVVFSDGPNWSMLLTEIPFFFIVFGLIEWMASKRKFLYYMIANLLISVIYFAVLMYYKYYGVIATYHALEQADKVTKVGESTYSLLDPYYLFIFVDIVVFMFFMFRPKYIAIWKERGMNRRMNRTALFGIISVSLAVCVFNVWPNHASMNENKKAESMGILNYEVYTIFADTRETEEIIDSKEITQPSINETKGITEPGSPKYWAAAQGKNLIVVQMESFQNFLLDLSIDGQEVTPNLNKLLKSEHYFNNFYTNAGQGTTSDAEFVVNTSLYVPHHEVATSSNYMDKALPSLPKLMKANGYNTATFHTNSVEFWNRKTLYKVLDFDKYYDQAFYGDGDHIAFGASDEVLYAKTVPELVKMDAKDDPFYAMVISMSAHHPYKMPESKNKMTLPKRYEGTLVGNYILAQNYADYAMGQFLDQLKSSGLWDDSVIVFYGDHQGVSLYSLDGNEKSLMEEMVGHEYGYTDMFNIPFIVHAPGVGQPTVYSQTGGQIDIMPTVANLLGISMKDQLYFGEDLMNQQTNMLPVRHFLPTGSFINDTSMYLTGVDYDDGDNFNLIDGSETEGGSTKEQFDAVQRLLNMSNSYIQQLPDLPSTDNAE
ncbi:LTA synthase family protein [Paenibacillus odorifer]|uniref:LTA synthase family protein n=1 Tax=Paenibacillus TaxID=44249 RepID=UPI00096C8507|nr:LTA synthase family protein [Paenibacillus odorifer]OMC90652.1 sulfatase [Paenibacillus odorifer]OME21063.1 sulfatase [Paenibacillus odorifer]OME38191.1 sulfatase [Paenibacillus odorifer]